MSPVAVLGPRALLEQCVLQRGGGSCFQENFVSQVNATVFSGMQHQVWSAATDTMMHHSGKMAEQKKCFYRMSGQTISDV